MTEEERGDGGRAFDLLRKGLDALVASEGVVRDAREVVGENAREAVSRVAQGTDWTKKELVRIVAGETRSFLDHIDLAGLASQILREHEVDISVKLSFRRKENEEAEAADEVPNPASEEGESSSGELD